MNGKPFSVDVYTISANGKALTEESTTMATNETSLSVSTDRNVVRQRPES
ncbi:MAG TPA: hypothetical protein VKB50_10110 [Vicinamibacterales bacterium]|nr:hypothetical protein [Vicinamibacterales bacterium]